MTLRSLGLMVVFVIVTKSRVAGAHPVMDPDPIAFGSMVVGTGKTLTGALTDSAQRTVSLEVASGCVVAQDISIFPNVAIDLTGSVSIQVTLDQNVLGAVACNVNILDQSGGLLGTFAITSTGI